MQLIELATQQLGKGTATGANLQHAVSRTRRDRTDDRIEHLFVDQKMLPKAFACAHA